MTLGRYAGRIILRWSNGAALNLHHPYAWTSQRNKSRKTQPAQHIISNKKQDIDVSKLRNIGVIAHVDAGKTTTTERFLYLSGFSETIGDVDSGDTITDYMEQERERGITITSAAVSFYWNKHRLNLIDTPGHVDFTLEVERCLRVLDGAVTILDASAGVEAQTVTVWRQTRHFDVPSVVFLNKMDKAGANVDRCLASIRDKLRIAPVLLQMPIGEKKSFRGVVDLVRMQMLEWPSDTDGKRFKKSTITETSPIFEELSIRRLALIEEVAAHDDHLAGVALGNEDRQSGDGVSAEELISAIRRGTLAGKLAPTLCGSSLRNVGVQPLLDAVCDYLPNPTEQHRSLSRFYGPDELCALVFKIIHDEHKGALTFVRLYSGSVSNNTKVYNVNRDVVETIQRVYLPHSDLMEDTVTVHAGDIAVLSNLKSSITGDTIVQSLETARKASVLYEKALKANEIEEDNAAVDVDLSQGGRLVLAGIETPEPVYFCSIEPPSYGQQQQFERALAALAREDPSLRFREDQESQQMIMEGMGELHIEIVKDRLLREYKLDVFLGPLQINYRESVRGVSETYHTLKETVNVDKHEVTLGLRVEPTLRGTGALKRLFLRNIVGDNYLAALPRVYTESVFEACKNTAQHGPLLGRQLQDIKVTLLDFACSRGCAHSLIGACASACLSEALKTAGVYLLEPTVRLEVTASNAHFNAIQAELFRRRAEMVDSDYETEHDSRIVHATVPLANVIDLNAWLRRATSGTAVMHIQVGKYVPVPSDQVQAIVKKVTGF